MEMDDRTPLTPASAETATSDALGPITQADLESVAETSRPFVGDWHQLVSQTNWQKGQLIHEWRERLRQSGAAPRLYSDPAWSRLVGEISPQHVGRLRRTFERFGDVHAAYEKLYWSHFFAALEWEDAEMWLEGAVANKWSVSKMRFQRWETLGAIASDKPNILDIIINPQDEGVNLISASAAAEEVVRKGDRESIQGPVFEGPDFGDEADSDAPAQPEAKSVKHRVDIEELLAELPASVSKSFSQFRLEIEKLKNDNWQSVKRIHLVALVNDLRQLLRTEPSPQ